MPRNLSNWIESYLEYTENTESCYLYRKWCAIATLSAVMQRKCVILGFSEGPIYPNLYIVLVGPTTARKGTAISQAKHFLYNPAVGVKIAADSMSKAALVRNFKRAEQTFTDSEGLLHIHSSLLAIAPELTVLFSLKDHGFLDALTDWYDTQKNPWIHETISGGEQGINGVLLTLLGGTTPAHLRLHLPPESIGGGLTGRMLLIYAPRKGKIVSNSIITKEEIKLQNILTRDLIEISNLGGQFKFTSEFLDTWIEWYEHFDEHEECKDDRFLGYFGRKPATLKKLSMIFSAAQRDTRLIHVEDFLLALEALDEVEKTMYYSLQGIGKNEWAALTQSVMEEVERVGETTMAKLLIRFRDDLDKFNMERILASLELMGFLGVFPGGKIKKMEGFNGNSENAYDSIRGNQANKRELFRNSAEGN